MNRPNFRPGGSVCESEWARYTSMYLQGSAANLKSTENQLELIGIGL